MMITKYAVVRMKRPLHSSLHNVGLTIIRPRPHQLLRTSDCFEILDKFSQDWEAQDFIDRQEHSEWFIIVPIREGVKTDVTP